MEEKGVDDEGRRVVGIALTGGAKCKHVIKWALEKYIPEGNVSFKLIHIYPMITVVPTPMGNLIPLPQVRDDIAAAYRKELEWQKTDVSSLSKSVCLFTESEQINQLRAMSSYLINKQHQLWKRVLSNIPVDFFINQAGLYCGNCPAASKIQPVY